MTKYVIQYHEGGIIQDEIADDDIKIIRFDFDETSYGDAEFSYIEQTIKDLRAVPEDSKTYQFAQNMLQSIEDSVEHLSLNRPDLVELFQ